MIVRIEELAVTAIIGVRDAERTQPQTLLVDVEFRIPNPVADELDATVNYSEVQAVAERCLEDGAFKLIETAAQATARRVAQTFGVDDVMVKVTKPAASRSAQAVSATYRLGLHPDFLRANAVPRQR